MLKISSKEIRDKFLNFFQNNDHLLIGGSSIIPQNDPTLLFINSGMAPIKKYFTGEEKPPKGMLCNVQPCIRTIDIDEVGDKHHLTNFQMLGSWSINCYFKEKAISLAFEFLTKYLQIPIKKLYVTVFAGDKSLNLLADEEAITYWKKIGISEDHIVKCGMDDNFWGPTSETGPCGPCTEVFYDTGEGPKYVPGGEFDTKSRYIEIWNAGVFMQFNKNVDGTFDKLSFSSVDTGAGLERLSMVLNGHTSVYDTDLLCPIKEHIKNLLGSRAKLLEQKDILIITDHLRTVNLILSEKVKPSNEGRGYIPRKLIRKCMMILSKNKIYDVDLCNISKFIIDNYSDIYKYFALNKEYIISTMKKEQEQFKKVIEDGVIKLENIKSQNCNISGEYAFELVTTYGLPFDIIKEFAAENKIDIDEASYNNLIKHHKEISKYSKESSENGTRELFEKVSDLQPTEFLGYNNFECCSKILNVFNEDDKTVLVLDNTCMYAESGGQVSDTGKIFADNFEANVLDVKKSKNGVFLHICDVKKGNVKPGDTVKINIDSLKRLNLQNNHTSVHLLHAALKSIFGKEVNQCGSKVDHSRLRLDFNYEKTITQDEIFKIENSVNEYIRKNAKRKVQIQKLSDAIKEGAVALFESKYGEDVRVVSFEGISKELCGGTHTERTGNIGLFVILSVESIGKGIKRITAIAGQDAVDYMHGKIECILDISKLLKVKPENLLEKMQKNLKDGLKKKNDEEIHVNRISDSDICFLNNITKAKFGYVLTSKKYKNLTDDIINLSDKFKSIMLCIISGGGKNDLIISVGKDCQNEFNANSIVKDFMKNVNGKGGGNPRVASGSTSASKDEIIKYFKNSF
ncbi:MAG: alanine--tRNA ligase [Oscillospiraceae bacterium]|jgi:alanyl-tRNA synthetase|nr:alanine--tRNA ligase [Oscillospiraceae bacterium]